MKNEKIFFWLLLAFYLFVVLIMTFKDYNNKKNALLEKIDTKLYTSAAALESILEKDFHDTYTIKKPPENKKYREIVNKLNHFVKEIDIEYVYSVSKYKGHYYFVVSNETKEDIERKTYSLFYNLYFDPPKDLIKAFENNETIFSSSYTNTWDSFRSVFIPKTTANNKRVVLAADIKVKHLNSILRESLIKSVLIDMIFIIPVFPVFFLLKRLADKREKELLKQIYFDPLTKLPNRNRFIHDSQNLCNEWITAIIFDIDSFREINDLFGGDTGDEILKNTSKILENNIRKKDLLYKFPADEYLMIMKNTLIEDAFIIAKNILNEVSISRFEKAGQEISFTISAGITEETADYKKLLSTANIAKNKAKREDTGIILYNKKLKQEKKFKDNLYWLRELKDALDEDRILPFFQPIKNNRTGKTDKYEALIRLIKKDGTIVSPFFFLNVAKKSKIYPELTRTVILKSFATFHDKQDISVSINLTARDFSNKDTMDYLINMVEVYKMEGRVIAEIVESESLDQNSGIFEIVDDLKKKGIKIAIDDFGSGFSNFEHLLKIKADFIKIDGSLIKNIHIDKNSKLIVNAIVSFARKMNLEIVAEFVSEEIIQKELEKIGIEYSQGFFIGKPTKI